MNNKFEFTTDSVEAKKINGLKEVLSIIGDRIILFVSLEGVYMEWKQFKEQLNIEYTPVVGDGIPPRLILHGKGFWLERRYDNYDDSTFWELREIPKMPLVKGIISIDLDEEEEI